MNNTTNKMSMNEVNANELIMANEMRVTDIDMIQLIKSTVLGFWPNRKTDTFAAACPVSIERKNFFKILQYPYVICVKSDGIRYLMLAMKYARDGDSERNYVFLINRAFDIFIVDVVFDDKVYGSTSNCGLLFDGELLGNEFIIHDCICIFGKDISNEHFNERYENVENVVNNFVSHSSQIVLKTKTFFTFDQIDKVVQLFNEPDHKIDGLIFTPVTLPVGTHTQYTLFKWKVKSQHTFDFKITEDPVSYIANTVQFKHETKFASVDKASPGGQVFSKLLSKNCPGFKSGDIVECEYNEQYDRYDPIKIRTDKAHPNNLYTIEKTLLNIKENITLDEIVERIKNNRK
jgi:hypothetical protein